MIRILLFGLIAAGAEIFGGALVALRKEWPRQIQEYLLALSAGFLLALVFFDLIPESLNLLGSTAPLYIVIGFGLLHFFEHTIVGHLHFGEETHADVMVSKMASLSAFSGLFIHAFFDGVSISAGMQYNFYIGMLVFIAILLHKLPEGLTIASIMIAARQPRNRCRSDTPVLETVGVNHTVACWHWQDVTADHGQRLVLEAQEEGAQ